MLFININRRHQMLTSDLYIHKQAKLRTFIQIHVYHTDRHTTTRLLPGKYGSSL